tara:strand:+ start:76 stop:978 length:903 start_codon:yes stop_codon:yes gene_type:complete
MNFSDQIKAAKPLISEKSVKTYNSLLRTIYKKVFNDDETPDIDNFKNVDKILDYMKDDNIQTRKTKLSAIMAIAPMPEYKEQILSDLKIVKEKTEKSEMTDKLELVEIKPEDMKAVVKSLKKNADAIHKKSELTMKDLQDIQNYIIVSLYHGHIQPRRAIDFTEMVLKPTNKETENYIDMKKSKLVFNKYKTASTYSTQEITIPASLKKILKKWIALIPDDVNNLLFNSKREPLSNVTLNQRLTEIFGANKGVNSLRHYYLTQNHSDTIRAEDKLANDMKAMGSSVKQARSYIKVNEKAK